MRNPNHRRMHWRSASSLKRAAAGAGHYIVTSKMCHQARARHAHHKVPNLAHRLGLHRIPVVIAMRQEFNQMRWETRKHNAKAVIGLAIVVALYGLVGYLEHAA